MWHEEEWLYRKSIEKLFEKWEILRQGSEQLNKWIERQKNRGEESSNINKKKR